MMSTITIGGEIKEKIPFVDKLNLTKNELKKIEEFYNKYFITDTKKSVLVQIGIGSTSQAWRIQDGDYEGKIVKSLRNDFLSTEARLDSILGFLRQAEIIGKLNERYNSEDFDYIMIANPKLYSSSLGPVFLSEATSRDGVVATLEDYVAGGSGEIREKEIRMIEALSLAIKIFDDLSVYHFNKLVSFDLKPQNLLKISIDSRGSFVVRNLDFGSCVYCDEIISEIKQIKKENENKGYILTDSQIEERLQKRFCRSSEVFYPPHRIKEHLKQCFACENDSQITDLLLDLDILAVLKIVSCFYFGPGKKSTECLNQLRNEWLANGLPKTMSDYTIFYTFANLILPARQKYFKNISGCREEVQYLLDFIGYPRGFHDVGTRGGLDSLNLAEFDYLLNDISDTELNREVFVERMKKNEPLRNAILNATISPVNLIEVLLIG